MTAKKPAEAAAYAAASQPRDGEHDRDGDAGVNPVAEPVAASRLAEDGLADDPQADDPQADERQADDPADGESHEHRVVHDLDELAAKAEKADEYLVLAQRTRADFENFRKRAARDAALAQERGITRLAKELLPAIDNLDRAVQAASTAGANQAGVDGADSQLVSGIKLVQTDLLAALARAGIEPFSPDGEAFDPRWHEAVAQHPVEGSEPGTVVEVYQQGYRLGDTVLRPARVIVAA